SRMHEARHGPRAEERKSAPDRIRTCGLRLRRPSLYPAELRAHTDLSAEARVSVWRAKAGAPGGSRTPGLQGRSLSLYPAELRARQDQPIAFSRKLRYLSVRSPSTRLHDKRSHLFAL